MAEQLPRVHDHDAPEGLIPVEEARARILDGIQPLAPLELPLTDAYGCVAAADIVAEVELPEFPSSAMDGYAVRAADLDGASPEHRAR